MAFKISAPVDPKGNLRPYVPPDKIEELLEVAIATYGTRHPPTDRRIYELTPPQLRVYPPIPHE
jgi:hypothetical protein